MYFFIICESDAKYIDLISYLIWKERVCCCLWMATFRGDVAETVRGDVVVFWLFAEMNFFFFYGGVQGGETFRDVQGRSVVIVSVSMENFAGS